MVPELEREAADAEGSKRPSSGQRRIRILPLSGVALNDARRYDKRASLSLRFWLDQLQLRLNSLQLMADLSTPASPGRQASNGSFRTQESARFMSSRFRLCPLGCGRGKSRREAERMVVSRSSPGRVFYSIQG
jgi:hypothetical protein